MVRNVYLRNRPNRSRYGREKGGKFEFWTFCTESRRLFWPVFWPRMVPRWRPMQFGGARWSLGGPGWSPDAAGGLPGGFGAQKECFGKLRKRGFSAPWRQDGWVLGVPPSIIVMNRAPCGAGLARKVLWDDDLAPFSSDKIRAKILDLGYG